MIKAVFDGRKVKKDMYREIKNDMILFIGKNHNSDHTQAGLIGSGTPDDVGDMLTSAMRVLARSMDEEPHLSYLRTIGSVGDFLTNLIDEVKDPETVKRLENERARLTVLLLEGMKAHTEGTSK